MSVTTNPNFAIGRARQLAPNFPGRGSIPTDEVTTSSTRNDSSGLTQIICVISYPTYYRPTDSTHSTHSTYPTYPRYQAR
jgi:hypothetical protein